MAKTQLLKKKLRGIRSIQKISKALKTASTVKFSRLNGKLAEFSAYSGEYRRLYQENSKAYDAVFTAANVELPPCLIVMAANKGMCGTFNSDTLSLAEELLRKEGAGWPVILCGKQAEVWFTEKNLPFEQVCIFDDVPQCEQGRILFDTVKTWLQNGRISGVKVVYPQYFNMMRQNPVVCSLLDGLKQETSKQTEMLYIPDRESVVSETAEKLLEALIFEKVLECAVGAQAATLMTMRSAYDTAVEYGQQLEKQINRIRQTQVTADVIETSSERSQEVT